MLIFFLGLFVAWVGILGFFNSRGSISQPVNRENEVIDREENELPVRRKHSEMANAFRDLWSELSRGA